MSRHLSSWGFLAVLVAGGLYAAASWNWCGPWQVSPPLVVASSSGEGPLRVGASKVPLAPPYPIVVGGYAPLRSEATEASFPLQVRALVLEVGTLRVGFVLVDLLTAPASLTEGLRTSVKDLGLSYVTLLASHSHTSMGAYDSGPLSQLAGTGKHREQATTVVVDTASRALKEAFARLEPATLQWGEGRFPSRVLSRSEGGQPADPRMTLARFTGEGGQTLAELLVFSAHPTLVPRRSPTVDPDWPGRLAASREGGGGVTLVLQGAGGNAKAVLLPEMKAQKVGRFAQALAKDADRVHLAPVTSPALAFARVTFSLPRPDASRLVPWGLRSVGDNLLCETAPREAELGALRLGPLQWLLLPAEPTSAAALQLERATKASRSLGLANGYLGYLETEAGVRAEQGESKRQYYDASLLMLMERAGRLASSAAGFAAN